MNNNFNNYNTNIDDYSESELLNLLELDSLDHTAIINKIDYLNNNYFKNNKLLSEFFFSIKDKLLNTNNLILDNNEDNNSVDDNSDDNNSVDNNSIDGNSTDNNSEYNSEYNNENIIESMTNMNNSNNNSNNSDTSDNSGNTETYYIYNYLHFNTLFRNSSNINFKTNSNFTLSSLVSNINEIKLSGINIKKPYLISNSKSNNKFRIKEYKNTDISNHIINISNGYYEDISELEDFLNNNYFYKSSTNTDNSNNFLKSLVFKIDKNTQQSIFDLCQNYIDNSNVNNFNYFKLDFNTDYIPYYSLAEILGFEINANDISNNKSIISNFSVNNSGNDIIFFCFDENQSNIIETHKVFLNNNLSSFKVLAKINTSSANKNNNYMIKEVYALNDRTDNIRKYSGLINLQNFNIKIIDYFGNIINQDSNLNFTFTLEAKIELTRLTNI